MERLSRSYTASTENSKAGNRRIFSRSASRSKVDTDCSDTGVPMTLRTPSAGQKKSLRKSLGNVDPSPGAKKKFNALLSKLKRSSSSVKDAEKGNRFPFRSPKPSTPSKKKPENKLAERLHSNSESYSLGEDDFDDDDDDVPPPPPLRTIKSDDVLSASPRIGLRKEIPTVRHVIRRCFQRFRNFSRVLGPTFGSPGMGAEAYLLASTRCCCIAS